MSVVLSQAHAEARLAATLSFLDSGPASARLRIFDGAQPALGAAPAGALLVEVALAEPAGVVAGGVLTLAPTSGAVIAASGEAAWARALNGAGALAWDCEVSGLEGSALVRLSTLTLVAGGTMPLVSGTLA